MMLRNIIYKNKTVWHLRRGDMSLQDPLRMEAIFRVAPLNTKRKSLLRPTYLAYFYMTIKEGLW